MGAVKALPFLPVDRNQSLTANDHSPTETACVVGDNASCAKGGLFVQAGPSSHRSKLQKLILLQLDKLAISTLGFVAQRRLARGVKLNHSEAVVSSQ